jgi:hypothetical protein
MSILELKSKIHEMVVLLQSEKALLKIFEAAKKAVDEEDLWDALSSEQIESLKNSIAKSKNKNLLLNHEDVKKRHAKWLSNPTIQQSNNLTI